MKLEQNGNNCAVLGTDADQATHVSKKTPLQTKRAEVMNDPKYRTKFENGIDPNREAATTKARRDGSVRPLGSSGAKK
jgi:hypothetical protein